MSEEGFIVVIAKKIDEYKLVVSQHIGSILLIVLSLWIGFWFPDELVKYKALETPDYTFWIKQYTPWAFLISALVSLYGGIGGALESKKKGEMVKELNKQLEENSDLSNKFEEAQLAIDYFRVEREDLVFGANSDFLGFLLNDQLGFNDTERASLYLHNGERFILAGRYSKNQDYTKKHRSAFPDSEGCIGQTWKNGGRYFIELPIDEDEYFDYLKNELSIDKGTVKLLKMKSRAYFSYALEEGYRRIGIILIESLKHDILNEEALYELTQSNEGMLIEMLKRSKKVSILVAYQNEEGGNV